MLMTSEPAYCLAVPVAKLLEKYQYLFTLTSLFSFGQVKFVATYPDGQVGIKSPVTHWPEL